MNQLRRHHISFRHAFEGISNAVTTQPNFKIHILFSLLAVWAGIYFRIDVYEWLFLSLTIFIGLGFELINTAIEHVVDLVTKDYRLEAKFAKDTAAGAMFIYTLGAILVATLIFLPKIIIFLRFRN